MYIESVSKLMSLYENLSSYNEETIKMQIVKPFLEALGYKPECFYCEQPTYSNKKRVDISIYTEDKTKILLFVEVKKGTEDLNIDNCVQLSDYLHQSHIEWGILTNGLTYILFNDNVGGKASQKEILRFRLDYNTLCKNYQTRYINNLKYFSYNYIFSSEATKYFIFLADFKIAMKKDMSFKQYESTIYGFFNYLAEKEEPYEIINIRPTNFKSYLIEDINNKKLKHRRYTSSKVTVINKYRYIKSLCDILKKKREIQTNPFENMTEYDMLRGISYEESNLEIEPLTFDEINMILSSYDKKRANTRNKLIFLLFLYCALDIRDIKMLKVENIDIERNRIFINNRSLPIPENILILIKEYLNFREKNKIKCEYLFFRKFYGEYSYLDDSSYNEIISKQFNLIDVSEDRKKYLTPSFIKVSVIKRMFENGIHIEDISKFTGMPLSTLEIYISPEDIYRKGNIYNIIKKHPYKKFLFEV